MVPARARSEAAVTDAPSLLKCSEMANTLNELEKVLHVQ